MTKFHLSYQVSREGPLASLAAFRTRLDVSIRMVRVRINFHWFQS